MGYQGPMRTHTIALFALAGCGVAEPVPVEPSASVTLVYSSRLDGEIEPCG